MLKKLTIEQFVIIDRVEIDFKPGLTVLTGETGAGKSILLDALGLILGDPSKQALIRQGAEQAVIEALFSLPADNPVWTFLADHGLPTSSQPELLIRRVIKKDDDAQILLNGKAVELDLLKKLGALLGEIHGQFANQSLLDPSNQLNLLDMSCTFPPGALQNVADTLHDLHRYQREQEEENTFFGLNMHAQGKMEAAVKRFEETGLHESEFEDIKARYSELITAYETSEAFQEVTAYLIASNGAIRALSAAIAAIERQKNLDSEKIKGLSALLAESLLNARDAITETNRLAPEYEIDTKPLHLYRARWIAMHKIAEELKIKLAELPGYYKDLVAKLDRVRNCRKRIAELGELIKSTEDAYRRYAHILTEERIVGGNALSKSINAELPPLKLLSAEFKVLVEERPNTTWTERGFNTATFMARMNPGMPFSPITETASGGELARLVLALKVVLQDIQTIPTLVFDEVDTGIGGAAAAAVGERIAYLAATTQVMVITHSPQVAARGEQHLHVSKKTDGVTTTSVLRMLSLEERTDEISRMLAGDAITAESQAAAKMLIDEAVSAASRRGNLKRA